jgi:HTH-type transcriptional regulator/antitoxin MqsA
MKTTKRECLNCEDGQMTHEIRDVVYEYRGHQTSIPNISGWFCNYCNEVEFDKGEGNRYAQAISNFSQEIDREEAIELAKTRKKLKLTQREAARLTGGGANAFSRYERGQTKPMLAIINLFKILGKHPEILKEICFKNNDHIEV